MVKVYLYMPWIEIPDSTDMGSFNHFSHVNVVKVVCGLSTI